MATSITKITLSKTSPCRPDILVGGTPCQSFSVAGKPQRDWTTLVVTSPLNSFDLAAALYGPDGWYGRTSPASCRLTEGEPLEPFSDSWGNSGMGSPGAFVTLNISEFPSAAVASSLSDILETGVLPQRYFLSAKACKGILRRAEKRGKALPTTLRLALERVAEDSTDPATPEARTASSPIPSEAIRVPEAIPLATRCLRRQQH